MPARISMAGIERESAALGAELLAAIAGVLADARFILGPQVTAFESEMSARLGGAHVVGCASGTDALVLALRVLDIGPGDEVIVPAFSYAATAEAVVAVGATPVFADIEPDSFAMDARSAAALVSPRTRALLPVHLFGQCARMDLLAELAAEGSMHIVEDAAQAVGARWRGKPAGTLGRIAGFSFYPTKNLGAAGDAGMVTTGDARLADRLRLLRTHGSRRDHLHDEIGLNSRLDELQAAVLRVKLPHLEAWNERRRAHASRYRAALRGSRLIAPAEIEGAVHVYHHFTVRSPARADLIARLAAAGIASAIYYPRPLHQQPAYARWARGPLPEAERAAGEVLSLPVHPWLREDEVERVAAALGAPG